MASSFLTPVYNFGSIRRVQSNGRDYYVAPVTLIVPGVLTGSLGPLLYPAREVANCARKWDGVDLTLGHPPSEEERIVLGFLRRPTVRNRKLVAEAWIDIKKVRKADPRILKALIKNGRIEVSTGVDATLKPFIGVWNGRVYKAIASDLEPDHLAILPDKVGACSIADGCGLNVANCSCQRNKKMKNKKTKTDLNDKQRSELIGQIVENSDGLYEEKDSELLSQFSDNQLLKMRQLQVDNEENDDDDEDEETRRRAANAARMKKKKEEEMKKRRAKNASKRVKNTQVENEDEDEDDDPLPLPKNKGKALNIQAEIKKYMKGLSAEDFYDLAPAEVQEVLATAKRTHNERKAELIEQLTAHCTNEEMKETVGDSFKDKDIEELELLAAAFSRPTRSDSNPFSISYIGNAGGPRPTAEMTKKDREDFLPLPVTNWKDEEAAVS